MGPVTETLLVVVPLCGLLLAESHVPDAASKRASVGSIHIRSSMALTYEKITYGTCAAHNEKPISTIDECTAAAVALGKADAKAQPLNSGNGPPGCYDNGLLWFNTQASQVEASMVQQVLCEKTPHTDPVVSCTFCGEPGAPPYYFMHLALPNYTFKLNTTAATEVLVASPCMAALAPDGMCSSDVVGDAAVVIDSGGTCHGLGRLTSNATVAFVPSERGWGANIAIPATTACSTVYHMACNRSAPVTAGPDPTVIRTDSAGTCTYHITWQHPSACADIVESPACTQPIPYPPEKYKCDSSLCTVPVFGGTLTKTECQASCSANSYKCIGGVCQKAPAGVPKVTCEAACNGETQSISV
eukprot:TRINITY_DN67630_c0_g1_i1.p1 TRINITY_DN67630_c0_g1~~TRINITY_DN67630_c0_g1_i1.p1  ORF type:complete len:358 (-),score=42.93 TRINITY_DN67630_c0_g1_i1:244-1317(-)